MDEHILAEKLKAARVIAQEYSTAADVLGVYVSGSLMAGVGTATSDADIFVITDEREAPELPPQRRVNGERVDVELISQRDIRTAIETVTRQDMYFGRMPLARPTWAQCDLAVRLWYSDPLWPSSSYESLLESLRDREAAMRQMLIMKSVLEIASMLEDLRGFLDADDAPSSVAATQRILTEACQAFLFGCGEYYIGKKWLFAKLRRLPPTTLPTEDVVASLLIGDPSAPSWQDDVTRRIRLAQAFVAAAQTEGWHRSEAWRWDAWGTTGAGPLRTIGWLPIRVGDEVLFSVDFPPRQFKAGVPALHLWGICDGSSSEEVIKSLNGSVEEAVEEADILRFLTKYHQEGLVTSG